MPQINLIVSDSTDLQSTPRTDPLELSATGRELSQQELDWVAGGIIGQCGPDCTVIHTTRGVFFD